MTNKLNPEILCVIPARGGSKGIPRKNIRLLAGKPLIHYSISAALGSKFVSRVIVSTEDNEIALIANDLGSEVPFLRPKELAEDNIHSVYPVIDVLKKLEATERYVPEAIIMLLPTSPLTCSHHIDEAFKRFSDLKSGSVISVCPFDKPVSAIRRIDGGMMKPVIDVENFNVQRQDFQLYIVNASIYIAKPAVLFKAKTFHTNEVYPYVMKKEDSLDINDMNDFENVSRIISERKL
jgi:CMP-N,N'-diacetyllegionaminic acid synthase